MVRSRIVPSPVPSPPSTRPHVMIRYGLTSVASGRGTTFLREQVGRFFVATEKPWSDTKARKVTFGNLSGAYFVGPPTADDEDAGRE